MSPYITLAAAITVEIIATSALKASEGFTKPVPTLLVVVGYSLAAYFMSLTMRGMPMGIAYGIWSGIGIVAITAVGLLFYRQSLDLPAVVGIAFILVGVVLINVFSKTTSL